MNVVDSSGWLEYFAGGSNSHFFAPTIKATDALVVPTICMVEVFKHLVAQRGEEDALLAVGIMSLGTIADLSQGIAINAAALSSEHKIAMVDSIILATARESDAVLWTQDVDFQGIDGVEYIAKA